VFEQRCVRLCRRLKRKLADRSGECPDIFALLRKHEHFTDVSSSKFNQQDRKELGVYNISYSIRNVAVFQSSAALRNFSATARCLMRGCSDCKKQRARGYEGAEKSIVFLRSICWQGT
jgi:hypothetical protein